MEDGVLSEGEEPVMDDSKDFQNGRCINTVSIDFTQFF